MIILPTLNLGTLTSVPTLEKIETRVVSWVGKQARKPVSLETNILTV